MILPALPEAPAVYLPLPSVKQHLLAIKQSLEKACRDVDSQIQALELEHGVMAPELSKPAEAMAQRLFEAPPKGHRAATAEVGFQDLMAEPMDTRLVMKATEPSALDPFLEKATLEELNEALSKAFVQMANRARW